MPDGLWWWQGPWTPRRARVTPSPKHRRGPTGGPNAPSWLHPLGSCRRLSARRLLFGSRPAAGARYPYRHALDLVWPARGRDQSLQGRPQGARLYRGRKPRHRDAGRRRRNDRVSAFAADLVERRVDVIVPLGPYAIQAARSATTTIPIVFTGIGTNFPLARSEGNTTGVAEDSSNRPPGGWPC